jgi:hypothetical protein
MNIEVMVYQRGYRIVYYSIITILSSLLFLSSLYFEYNNIKLCFIEIQNVSAINFLFKKEMISIAIIGIILMAYLFESFYLKNLIFDIIKSWNYIDYGKGKMTIWQQIFFWRIKSHFNYIMKIAYAIIFVGIMLYYLFL